MFLVHVCQNNIVQGVKRCRWSLLSFLTIRREQSGLSLVLSTFPMRILSWFLCYVYKRMDGCDGNAFEEGVFSGMLGLLLR